MQEKIFIDKKIQEYKNSGEFNTIEKIASGEEEFNEALYNVALFETIAHQVNEIYIETLYNLENTKMIDAIRHNLTYLCNNFKEVFIKKTTEENAIPEVPDLTILISWIEELHFDTSEQLYSKTISGNVIQPAIENISQAILETAEEEQEEPEEQEEGEKDEN